ncbi:MAG: long-chain fatty acid--CoA ligase [Ktedonobacteraceae bacterium]|nr:long-chain fatty acid--CoA ligase [Ktedonobacteraceae bacterium]
MSDASIINNKNIQAEPHLSTSSGAGELQYPWFQYYESGVPAHLEIPDHPLTWLLDCTASCYPSNTAFIYYGTRISYAQFSSYANRFAAALQRLGVKKGDRVAIALPNIPQYPIACYGALKVGAVVVPTNPLYTEHEMQQQLADASARVMVMLDSFYPIVRKVRGQTALEHVIVTSPADFFPTTLRILYPLSQRKAKYPEPHLTAKELHDDPTLHEMYRMLESRKSGDVEQFHSPVALLGSDLAVLQYTGGTTGLAKGAMLTQRNLLSNAIQTRSWCPRAVDGEEVMLCAAPFFHSYGLTVCLNFSILTAATMVLLPRFKTKEVMTAIRKYRPTMFPGIPTMYIALMREVGKHTEYMRSIKYCISGAAPLPARVQADFEVMTHGKLVEGYGLSEASPVTHANPLTEQSRNGSIGLPLPNVEATILHQQTGQPLAVGEVGELAVRGPNIMQGYWNRQQETEAIFTPDGWMRTGDIGKMDADGYFYIVERAKDLIIASGFNVYPHEVEEVLFQHPTVSEAAVVGLPDEYRGETVAAFVVLKPSIEPSEKTKQELLDYCKQYLAAYKVPKKLEFRTSLPKSIIGKVLRRELRAS